MNLTNENGHGVVFRKSLGHYTVHTSGRQIDCELSSRLHKQLIHPASASLRHNVKTVRELDHADPLAIGDEVRFLDAGPGRGLIR